MAIYVKCCNSSILLDKIKKRIDGGDIAMWRYDEEGDFYHFPSKLNYSGWFHPVVEPEQLVLGLLGAKEKVMSTKNYAVYHSRFVEMLLGFFDDEFESIEVSAQKTKYDIF